MTQQIIQTFTDGIGGVVTAIGNAIVDSFNAVFLTTGTDGAVALSNVGTVIIVFAGVSLGLGLGYVALNLIKGRHA